MKKIFFVALLIVIFIFQIGFVSAQEPEPQVPPFIIDDSYGCVVAATALGDDTYQIKLSGEPEACRGEFSIEVEVTDQREYYFVSTNPVQCTVMDISTAYLSVIYCNDGVGIIPGLVGYRWQNTPYKLTDPVEFATNDLLGDWSCDGQIMLDTEDNVSLLLSCNSNSADFEPFYYHFVIGSAVYETGIP
jgi:hypothetical protein